MLLRSALVAIVCGVTSMLVGCGQSAVTCPKWALEDGPPAITETTSAKTTQAKKTATTADPTYRDAQLATWGRTESDDDDEDYGF